MPDPRVVFVLPDKMGGVLNIVRSLLDSRDACALPYDVVFTDNRLSLDTRFGGLLNTDRQTTVRYALPVENIYAVLRRLRRAIPNDGGVLVSNDQLELAMLHVHDPGMMVVQILHGDHPYYYDLAVRHQGVIDVFVAYSRAMYDELLRRLPARANDIVHLPYGVALPPRIRRPHQGPLRLVFAGRLEHGQKGILDLPRIDAALAERDIKVEWTIFGGGPDDDSLRRQWSAPHVSWRGVVDHDQLIGALADFDVFVLPTRREGFPVALVEAMAAGLVPVVSDITSGVPEVVTHGETGFRPPVGDVAAFADAIAALNRDRPLLDRMSEAARSVVAEKFDARAAARGYRQLFDQWRERRRPREASPLPYGSRLDQPWMPNPVVRTVRSVVRQWQGKPW